MKLLEGVHLVGSGEVGISDPGDCHVYLIDGGAELALVDAGGGAGVERILANIQEAGYNLRQIGSILLTHAHRDHAGGCNALKQALLAAGGSVRICASQLEADLLRGGTAEQLGLDRLGLAGIPRDQAYPPVVVDQVLADGQVFTVGDLPVTAVLVPGHNPGCLCYLAEWPGCRALFAGDVVYSGGVISLGNWPGSDSQAYQAGLKKLAGLAVDALFSGHLLWKLRGGQAAIDQANQAFAGLWPPPNINLVP
jgi:glyoxylase-like metal-dependent hydrolase (beta-lactamase superfamily II)